MPIFEYEYLMKWTENNKNYVKRISYNIGNSYMIYRSNIIFIIML